ncbi:hypothetical protein D477_003163 [Arthrobacter crystallopoietes BAB-32]|uniref:Uncharacterized protein n=1 Tax=Arthrobacter crystallopoietes BAB-32 TaxID=1246476 RepID=N1UZ31_9MICC|nr:hypothetical protein D477_003163 [Arthrobacter crystallopoietes BAB-32]
MSASATFQIRPVMALLACARVTCAFFSGRRPGMTVCQAFAAAFAGCSPHRSQGRPPLAVIRVQT